MQRNLGAADIAVVFPNPCATLPRDRTGNGWTSLGPTNDDSTVLLNILFSFSLFGETLTSLRIYNDGYIAFSSAGPNWFVNGWYTNIDTRGSTSGLVWYKAIGGNTFAAVWDRVGVYNQDDPDPNTFQIMISDGTNPDMGIGYLHLLFGNGQCGGSCGLYKH